MLEIEPQRSIAFLAVAGTTAAITAWLRGEAAHDLALDRRRARCQPGRLELAGPGGHLLLDALAKDCSALMEGLDAGQATLPATDPVAPPEGVFRPN
jgi:hypothetical protein